MLGDFNDWFWPGSLRDALKRELPATDAARDVPVVVPAPAPRPHLLLAAAHPAAQLRRPQRAPRLRSPAGDRGHRSVDWSARSRRVTPPAPGPARSGHRRCRPSPPCRAAASAAVKRGAVFLLQPLAQLDEALRAHHVDVGQRAAGERREAEAEDRADIGLAHVGDDALLDAARGFQRLHHQEAVLELLDVDRCRDRASSAADRRAPATAASGRPADSRRSPCRSCGRAGRASRPAPPAALLLRVDRLRRRDRLRSALQDLPAEIERHLVVERERADRHAGHARRRSRSSPPARPPCSIRWPSWM